MLGAYIVDINLLITVHCFPGCYETRSYVQLLVIDFFHLFPTVVWGLSSVPIYLRKVFIVFCMYLGCKEIYT